MTSTRPAVSTRGVAKTLNGRQPASRPGEPRMPEHEVLAAMAAHDLREPVHAIQGFISVLRSDQAGATTPLQRDFLDSMFHAARRIERLINDIQIILSRQRGFSLVTEPTDLRAHLQSCIQELMPVADATRLDLQVDVAPLPSAAVDGWTILVDPLRLEQILLNLLENAIRYGDPDTTIRVRLRRTASRVLCVVENQAIHLADDDPSRWIMPFERGQRGMAASRSGRGLGLTVVDHLVRAHGGRVLLRRRGITVAIGFYLPAAAAASTAELAPGDSARDNSRDRRREFR
jgi:signal transduction histidine kinase